MTILKELLKNKKKLSRIKTWFLNLKKFTMFNGLLIQRHKIKLNSSQNRTGMQRGIIMRQAPWTKLTQNNNLRQSEEIKHIIQ